MLRIRQSQPKEEIELQCAEARAISQFGTALGTNLMEQCIFI